MFGSKQNGREGEIDVTEYDILDDSREFARLWHEPDGPFTCLIEPRNLGPDPFLFGMAMIDTIRHAARAYAQAVGTTEDDALERIFEGFDAERAKNTTGLDTIQDLGEPN
jgi:hypothetical protein